MKKNLDYWQDWVGKNESAYNKEYERMDKREALYRGEVREIEPLTARDTEEDGSKRKVIHLRNIIAELIESEVNSVIPQPKVTARRKGDEARAKILEDMLRNELDRLPMEEINDMAERMVPKQGGAFWLVEWDNSEKTHSSVGDVVITLLHPKQIIPQDGVLGRVEDMDAIGLKLAKTRSQIKREYGKDVEESESDPDARTLDSDAASADELVTQYVVYFRNDDGGVGKISWVGDVLLEEIEDFEARRLKRCANCGEILQPDQKTCPKCGTEKTTEGTEDTEEIWDLNGITTANGTQIPGAQKVMDEMGLPAVIPTELPYYKPDCFPIFLQRNVSLFGKLLGDSDVDKIEDQQNTMNRLENKIIDRMIKAGTRITLPDRADFKVDPQDGEKWYIGNPADKAMIGVYEFSGNLQYEMTYMAQVYEEARQILGITDSFQGRRDETATSGVAKEFAAAQSAGRLESKRVLKEAAYAELFKRIVQLKVAYADEARPIVATDDRGQAQYEEFNRYDFYEQDENGWHCILDDDRFLFSCDVSAPLASNRERMWQETTQMLLNGAFGQPQALETLLLYWTKMELLHYPGASDTKEYLVKLREEQMQQQMQMEQMRLDQERKLKEQEMAMQQAERDRQMKQETEDRAQADARWMIEAMQARQNGPMPIPRGR